MSEERLKRIEILLETCAKNTLKNEAQITKNSEQLDRVTDRIDQLTIQMASLSEMFTDTVRIIKKQQSEIKGLQTENIPGKRQTPKRTVTPKASI